MIRFDLDLLPQSQWARYCLKREMSDFPFASPSAAALALTYYTTIRQARAANQSAKSAAQPRKLRLGNAHTRRLFVRKLQAVLLLCFANCCLGLLIPKHTQESRKEKTYPGFGEIIADSIDTDESHLSLYYYNECGHNGFWVIRASSYRIFIER